MYMKKDGQNDNKDFKNLTLKQNINTDLENFEDQPCRFDCWKK